MQAGGGRLNDVAAVRTLFSQALQIDPTNADALAGNAATYIGEYVRAKNPEVDYEAKILGQVDRAIALDRRNTNAYRTKAQYLAISARPTESLRAADAGLAIDPNSASLYATRSTAETYLRQFDKAKSDLQQAMLLSPRDPAIAMWHNLMGDAELGLGHFDAAIDECNKAIDGGYRIVYSYLNLAAAHTFKGEMDDAKIALAEARRLKPDLSIKWLNEHKPVLQAAFDGLRKAGLPEE
jgi:adenylate cyclase